MDSVYLQSYEGAVELTRGPDDVYDDNILKLYQEEADALGPKFLTFLKEMQNYNQFLERTKDDWWTWTNEEEDLKQFGENERAINDTIESIAANTGITVEDLYEALGEYASANGINATSVIQNNNSYEENILGRGERISHLNSALFTGTTASD